MANDLIQNLLQALMGRNMGQYLTPGWNGEANPMSPQAQQRTNAIPGTGQIPNAGTQPQAVFDIIRAINQATQGQQQAPPQQPPGQPQPQPPAQPQPQQGGIRAALMGMLKNPQLYQALGGLALGAGKYGGARGQGYWQGIYQQRQMQQQQAEAAQRQAQWEAEQKGKSAKEDRDYQDKIAKTQMDAYQSAITNMQKEIGMIQDPSAPEAAQAAEQIARWYAEDMGLNETYTQKLVTRAQSLVRAMAPRKDLKVAEPTYRTYSASGSLGGDKTPLTIPENRYQTLNETQRGVLGASQPMTKEEIGIRKDLQPKAEPRDTDAAIKRDVYAEAEYGKKFAQLDATQKRQILKTMATEVPQFNFNLKNQSTAPSMPLGLSKDEMIKTLPANQQAMVKAILEYRTQPTGYMLSRDPGWKAAYDLALQIDPTYNAQRYGVRSSMWKDYTSAKGSSAGAQINAINTVIGHTAVLGEAIAALENGNIQLLNQIANTYNVQTGKDPVTTLKAIVNRVGPELERAYVGTGGEASERQENKQDFNPKYSPQQLKANVAITIKLLRSKIGALEQQWNREFNSDDFEGKFLTPEAKAGLQKWGDVNQSAGQGSSDWNQFYKVK